MSQKGVLRSEEAINRKQITVIECAEYGWMCGCVYGWIATASSAKHHECIQHLGERAHLYVRGPVMLL